jgi:hypothetical protein
MVLYVLTFTFLDSRRDDKRNTHALYSGGPGLKCRPGKRLSWKKFFVIFCSPSGRMPG